MKISLFFDQFQPYHGDKDPGQIPLGLIENGTSADVITVKKTELANYKPEFRITQKTPDELESEQFWSELDTDAILAYTWLGRSYTPLIEKMKAGGKKVIIKSDTNGRVGYPFKPFYLNGPLSEKLTISNIIRNIGWNLPIKALHSKINRQVTRQIDLSDGVIVESPGGVSNLNLYLATWARRDLIKKTHFVPNPVTPEFIESDISKKENIVFSSGRWADFNKNAELLVETATEFLKERQEYRVIIVGTEIERVKKLVEEVPENILGRINIVGRIEHKKVCGMLANAKIFLLPSRWESYSISTAEAICMGCTAVGAPLESLRYFSMEGTSGTVGATYDKKAVLGALLHDAAKWDNGNYDPNEIAKFWRARLNRKAIAKTIENLAMGRNKQLI
jgi:glycosyltransferase involved in cell wall biosynthesis